jgi:hypothetical protein
MVEFATHNFKGEVREDELKQALELARTALPQLAQTNPVGCGDSMNELYTAACGASHLGRTREALELAHAACDCAGAMFRAISARPNTTVSFNVHGERLSGPSGQATELCEVRSWTLELMFAAALRRQDVVDTLADVPVRVLQMAPADQDDCFRELAHVLQAFFLNENFAEPLSAFERLSKPKHLQFAEVADVRRFAALTASLLAIAARNQAAFDEAIVVQLTAHKKTMGRGSDGQEVTSLIDCLAAGAAVLGQTRGLKLNVKSGYLPTWLVEVKHLTPA